MENPKPTLWNPSLRTPEILVSHTAIHGVNVSNANANLWVPATGKRIRLYRLHMRSSSEVTTALQNNIQILEQPAGNLIHDYFWNSSGAFASLGYPLADTIEFPPNGILFPVDSYLVVALEHVFTAGLVRIEAWGSEE